VKSTVINECAAERIKNIHRLSVRCNASGKVSHRDKILSMIKAHAAEIEELSAAADRRHLIETGDLIILCCELILEAEESVDETLLKCFDRFESKLDSPAANGNTDKGGEANCEKK